MAPHFDLGIDFAAAEKETERKPLPESDYDVQIAESTFGETGPEAKNPGADMLKLVFEVINHSEHNGRKVFYNIVLPTASNKGSLFRVVELFKAIGLQWTGTGFDSEELLGRSCKARIGTREYNGNINNEIKKLF